MRQGARAQVLGPRQQEDDEPSERGSTGRTPRPRGARGGGVSRVGLVQGAPPPPGGGAHSGDPPLTEDPFAPFGPGGPCGKGGWGVSRRGPLSSMVPHGLSLVSASPHPHVPFPGAHASTCLTEEVGKGPGCSWCSPTRGPLSLHNLPRQEIPVHAVGVRRQRACWPLALTRSPPALGAVSDSPGAPRPCGPRPWPRWAGRGSRPWRRCYSAGSPTTQGARAGHLEEGPRVLVSWPGQLCSW